MRQIAVIQGNPDPRNHHYGHALADAYAQAASRAGHAVKTIQVASLEFPWLRTEDDFNSGAPPVISEAQRTLAWAEHFLIVFPLWHGTMPSILKAFIEQTFRPGFAMRYQPGRFPKRLLTGKSARLVVTMGMPALAYRWLFRAHGVRALETSILRWSGVAPVRTCYIGNIADPDPRQRERWLERISEWGASAS